MTPTPLFVIRRRRADGKGWEYYSAVASVPNGEWGPQRSAQIFERPYDGFVNGTDEHFCRLVPTVRWDYEDTSGRRVPYCTHHDPHINRRAMGGRVIRVTTWRVEPVEGGAS